MQVIGSNPPRMPDEALRALARLALKRAAEAKQADEPTGPEHLGDIAPRAAAEIIQRGKQPADK